MVLRKARLAAQARGHRCAQELSELLQLRPGLRPVHTGARIDEWTLRREDRRGGLAHIRGVRRGACFHHRRVVEVADLLLPDIGGYLDETRAAAAVAQLRECAP